MSNPPVYPLAVRTHAAASGDQFLRIKFWPKHGEFRCVGLRSLLNGPEEYLLMSVDAGSVPCLRGGPVDLSAYSIGRHQLPAAARPSDGYWPFPMPTISKSRPGLIRASLLHSPSFVPIFSLTFYGHLTDGSSGPFVLEVENANSPCDIEPCMKCGKPPPYKPGIWPEPVPVCRDCGGVDP